MQRYPILAAVALVGFVACGGTAKSATPPAATTTTVAATTTSTLPSGVGTLCAKSAGSLVDYVIGTLHNNVTSAQYADTPFHTLLDRSLDDCATRIEWLTAIEGYGGGNETALDGMYQAGCKVDDFLQTSMAKVGVDKPSPIACQGGG